MGENLKFKISSALKDILGRDLITDDYIAVFELVKNSFDAHATEVEIKFENIESNNSRIIIKDNGKGMNYDDLLNKWLFVAYSAKRDGTEDDNFDYRSNIHLNRPFAGAKGIGRFSCDKLGKRLFLETTKHELNKKTETLFTEWEKFEGNIKSEFIDIDIIHETKEFSDYNLEHGTVLIIEGLREEWTRKKLLKLKDSLAKLINPSKDIGDKIFKIKICVPEEVDRDSESKEIYDKVNGEVQNFIFETLGLKTTKITSSISSDGKYIYTELKDGGTLIYKIKELNTFNLLNDIEVIIYYLNMSAKYTFTRRMGLSSNQYGHIFLYKNGFRVYPYGEPGEDPLRLDLRKAQGYNRFLGTREVLGQININSKTDQLKETSTRGDGLIKTHTYFQLEQFFLEVLKKLERYVVDVQQWGYSIEDENSFNVKSRISDLIAKLTGNADLIDFETTDNFLNIIEASQVNSAETIVKNLKKLALNSGDDSLLQEVKNASIKLQELHDAKESAEQQAFLESKKAQEATAKLKEKISENLFLKSINTSDYQEVIALLHHIGIYAGTIDNNLKGISLRVQNDIPLSKIELNNIVRTLSLEAKKILNIVAFATKANFKLKTEEFEIDLCNYMLEYIQNIIPTVTDRSLKIKVINKNNKPFIRTIKAIEMNIVIDNIINNAKKAKADELIITFTLNVDGTLDVQFKDNGIGIEDSYINQIYDFGFTTTDGSGLGLFHTKEILDSLNAKILATNNIGSSGATFTIKFK